jgi:hypothetical protein
MLANTEQVIAPKRETATLLKALRVKSELVAGGFALGELSRSASSHYNRDENIFSFFDFVVRERLFVCSGLHLYSVAR